MSNYFLNNWYRMKVLGTDNPDSFHHPAILRHAKMEKRLWLINNIHMKDPHSTFLNSTTALDLIRLCLWRAAQENTIIQTIKQIYTTMHIKFSHFSANSTKIEQKLWSKNHKLTNHTVNQTLHNHTAASNSTTLPMHYIPNLPRTFPQLPTNNKTAQK